MTKYEQIKHSLLSDPKKSDNSLRIEFRVGAATVAAIRASLGLAPTRRRLGCASEKELAFLRANRDLTNAKAAKKLEVSVDRVAKLRAENDLQRIRDVKPRERLGVCKVCGALTKNRKCDNESEHAALIKSRATAARLRSTSALYKWHHIGEEGQLETGRKVSYTDVEGE